MTEFTPGYSLPSPVDTEAPNGPAQIKALAEAVEAALATLVPAGSIIQTARSTAPNEKWLLCQGQEVSRTTYATLFAAIGTTYGAGNGSTTFNLPDGRERVLAGKAASGTLGTLAAKTGAQTVTLGVAEIPNHTHSPGSYQITSVPSSGQTLENNENVYTSLGSFVAVSTWGFPNRGVSGESGGMVQSGGGAAHNNLQPTLVVNHLIKT